VIMPYSAQHKLETRQKILESARRLFNLKGYAAVSIEDVMSDAGLTHGGFYRHFSGKDELYAEAVRWFLCPEASKPWQRPKRRAKAAGESQARRIVDAYFSRDHFTDRETCCPLIGLPSEISHGGETVTAAYQEVLEQLLARLEPDLAGDARERALTLVTLCIGGLVASRNVADPALARALREAAYRQAQSVLEGRPC
jgi:TetR/AcrR family transcriptional repressor of nem operon